jgi:4a-hydroxytetrahydrobiopterin dehydratase
VFLHPRISRFKGDVTVAGPEGFQAAANRKHKLKTMATLIVQSQLQEMMKRIPEWEADGNAIERTFEFDDFDQTIDFVNEVAEIALEEEHHPDIDIRFNKVRIALSTHSEGGVTELDLRMAAKIDNLTE